jgi:AcrR family transcriptional regulator
LLRAAVDRFGAQGFRATSVSQLSRDAGLTPAAAYAYFDDKEAFWREAVSADLDALRDEILGPALASGRPILEMLKSLVTELRQHPLALRVLVEGTVDDMRLVLNHNLFAGTTRVVADGLAARQRAGKLSPAHDPMELATGFETVLFALVVSVVRAGFDGVDERIESVLALMTVAVGGPPTREEMQAH